MSDLYLTCPECPHRQWVSPEDQDASLGEMWNHVQADHARFNRARTEEIMARVGEVTE